MIKNRILVLALGLHLSQLKQKFNHLFLNLFLEQSYKKQGLKIMIILIYIIKIILLMLYLPGYFLFTSLTLFDLFDFLENSLGIPIIHFFKRNPNEDLNPLYLLRNIIIGIVLTGLGYLIIVF